jgi:hypothetical protein
MKPNLLKFAVLSILGIIAGINLLAQSQASIYTDLGQSVLYDGLVVKNAGLINYEAGKYKAETGFQLGIKNSNNLLLSGFALKFSRDFLLRNFPFEVQAFYVVTPSSSLLRETNWGVVTNFGRNHVKMSIGTNFRTFAFTGRSIRELGIGSHTRIHELWNLVYSFGYYIKPVNHPWNFAMTITDLDYFSFEHETNPVLSLQFLCKINPSAGVFAETRYKGNVPFNLNMNYFGFVFRIGVIIKI